MVEENGVVYKVRRCCHNCHNMVDEGDVREQWLRCTEHITFTIRRDGYCSDHDWCNRIRQEMDLMTSFED